MTIHFVDTIKKSDAWLKNHVFPLWTQHAFDQVTGGFVESLDSAGNPEKSSRRAMVQARQIYAYTEAVKMNILSKNEVSPILKKNIEFIKNYSMPSGAYIHAVDTLNKPDQLQSELYTQAFMLFGLARAYEVLRDSEIKDRALKLIRYLYSERKNKFGGFVEIKKDQFV